ncbi:MAG TPA: MXAN_6640 family putative metalloprotease [Solirubrobacterales bacterium]|nr:MXAN_6640 family putative metalloprotease [Solirubrobacterales bacterium]
MRRLVLVSSLLAALVLSVPAAGASAASAIDEREARKALDVALEAFRAPLAAGPAAGERDVTGLLRDLAIALPALSGHDRAVARDLLARPTDKSDRNYFGKEAQDSPTCDAQFCVHWTDKRRNRPASSAFLDQVRVAVQRSYAVENGMLGWRRAKSDGRLGARHGVGGQGQVDVYVTDLGRNLYGFAAPDHDQRGHRRHAYLVLDNDYTGFPTPPVQSMRVTVAHEYNHILQFGYDTFEDLWLFEDTATWAEEKVYPEIDDYLNYLPSMSARPQAPMTGSSIKVYAEAVWNHWLSSRYGDGVVRRTWEVSPAERNFAVDAYGAALKDAGGLSFGRELGAFFAATAEWQGNPAFPDHAVYPRVARARLYGGVRRTTLDNTSYRLFNVKPGTVGESALLRVRAERGTRTSISLVGRVGGGQGPTTVATTYLRKGGRGRVSLDDLATYSRVTAVVANVDGRSNRRDRRGRRVYRADGSTYRIALR